MKILSLLLCLTASAFGYSQVPTAPVYVVNGSTTSYTGRLPIAPVFVTNLNDQLLSSTVTVPPSLIDLSTVTTKFNAVDAALSTAAYLVSSQTFSGSNTFLGPVTLKSSFTIVGGSISFVNPGFINNVNYVQFNTTWADGSAEGRQQWNINDGTLEVGMPGGNVNLQMGQEMLVRVKNDSGSNILNGQVVQITGESGNRPTIGLADADVPSMAMDVLGLATEDIDDGQTGYVTMEGLVRDLNTNSYTAGDPLYLDITAGGWTKTIPPYPARVVHIGHVITKGLANGTVLVHMNEVTDQINTSSITAIRMQVIGSDFSVGVSTFVVSGGNVGIGKTAPTAALDVVGSINATSTVTANRGNFYVPMAVLVSTETQTIVNSTTSQTITFSTWSFYDGNSIVRVSSTVYRIAEDGVYGIIISAIMDLASGSVPQHMGIWLRKNGVDVPNTNTIVHLNATTMETVIAVDLVDRFVVNDTFELVFYGENENCRLLYTAAGTAPIRPASPSVITTVKRLSR